MDPLAMVLTVLFLLVVALSFYSTYVDREPAKPVEKRTYRPRKRWRRKTWDDE